MALLWSRLQEREEGSAQLRVPHLAQQGVSSSSVLRPDPRRLSPTTRRWKVPPMQSKTHHRLLETGRMSPGGGRCELEGEFGWLI